MPTTTDISTYARLCLCIISEQEAIVGPISWNEAEKIEGLTIVDREEGEILITGDPKQVVDDLVEGYALLFSRLSRKVSRDSAALLLRKIHPEDVPECLR